MGKFQKNQHGFYFSPFTFAFYMDFRFASVAACGCCDKDCRVICYYLVYIYCPKESKCHALARFVLFVRLVFEKTFAYVKLNTNLPLTNHLICRQNQKTNPSTFPLVLPRYNQNQNENQKMKILFLLSPHYKSLTRRPHDLTNDLIF